MRPSLFGRIAILGTGVIGGSLAAAIKSRQVALNIAAYDTSADALSFLKNGHYIDAAYDNAADAVKDADLVLFCVPSGEMGKLAAAIATHLKKGVILTDVASVKRKAIEAVTPHLPPHVRLVPGHPIAGSEKSGATALNPSLFEEKRVILTPSENDVLSEPVAQVRSLWEALGAQVEYMPADLHDRIYAYISHLPQLAAFAAKPYVTTQEDATRGVLRLSQSPIPLWTDICFANADFIHEALEEFITFLSQMSHELLENEGEEESAGETAAVSSEDHAPSLLCALIALCLVATALLLEQRSGIQASRYGGSGFRDMVAAAGNQSDSVLAAISAQPKEVGVLLAALLNRLGAIGAALSTGDQDNLAKALSSA